MPNTFIPGTKILSLKVNENFTACKNAINENGTEIDATKEELEEFKTDTGERFDEIEPQIMPDYGNIYEEKSFIVSEEKNKITIKKGTKIRLTVADNDVRYLDVKEDLSLAIHSLLDDGFTFQGGKDYSIYLVAKDTLDTETQITTKETEIKVSMNSTYPKDYTAQNSRKIGGFHTLCVAVTSANAPYAGHPATGFSAGDLIPNSVWCLSHRPKSEPNGMVYVDLIDMWVDIYLQSGRFTVSGGTLTTASTFGATVTDTRAYDDHTEDFFRVQKRMPTHDEFSVLAEGSNQKTAIYGSASPTPKTAGGHVDTAGKRMISGYFIEECCGFLYQWIANPSANGGTGWANYDSLAGAKGQNYGASYALLAGGNWVDGASCGSRCRHAYYARSYASASFGGRGVSCPKQFA